MASGLILGPTGVPLQPRGSINFNYDNFSSGSWPAVRTPHNDATIGALFHTDFWTLGVWIRILRAPPSTVANEGILVWGGGDTDQLIFQSGAFGLNCLTGYVGTFVPILPAGSYPEGKWLYWALARESSSMIRAVAIDERGNIVYHRTNAFEASGRGTGNEVVGIGHNAYSTQTIKHADISGLSIWDRPLTPREIAIASRFRGQSSPGLVDHWDLDRPPESGFEVSSVSSRIATISGDAQGESLGQNVSHYNWRLPLGGGGVTVVPGTATLTLTPQTPTVVNNVTVTPGAASLTLTPQAPEVRTDVTAIPGTATLTLTPTAPEVVNDQTVTPGTATLTTAPAAPEVRTDVTVVPGTPALTATPFAPEVLAPRTSVPGAGTLTLTPLAPEVIAGGSVTVIPGTATLTTTPRAPEVITNTTVTPGTATTTLTGYVPSVTTGQDVNVTPGPRALSLTEYAPEVIAGGSVNIGTAPPTPLTFFPYRPTAGTIPIPIITTGPMVGDSTVEEGDEWCLRLSGPSADSPSVVVVIDFRQK